jgi:hypothetical protein
MISKVFAILSAGMLVAAVAVATLAPENLSLGAVLNQLNSSWPRGLQLWLRGHGMGWGWDNFLLPLLQRPAWLVPTALGMICAGGAATWRPPGAPRSHHRRS